MMGKNVSRHLQKKRRVRSVRCEGSVSLMLSWNFHILTWEGRGSLSQMNLQWEPPVPSE